jgi:hypothetical protein
VALAGFLHRLRPASIEEHHALRLYAAQVRQIATRLQAVFDEWSTTRETEVDNARLGNIAAVNRWHLMRLAKEAEGLSPPRSMDGVQRDLAGAVLNAARACQLLANGYRFHKYEAVCDGQSLLLDSVQEMSQLLEQLQAR